MILGLIPAAGKSTRMGQAKLLLPVGGKPVLEHTISVLRAAGIDKVLVVVGPHVPELGAIASQSGAHVLGLEKDTPDMRSTVEHGLRWLDENLHPSDQDFWLLIPADHPTLDAKSVQELFQAAKQTKSASIFIPTFGGRRGHPALIGWKHVNSIRGQAAGQAINAWMREHSAETSFVPVQSDTILCDLDTPEDYERLKTRWASLVESDTSTP
jgi:molybdenum cofactor cytidylyltransferase